MAESGPRVFAVDWSGKLKGSAETIWLAEARAGQIVQLENGRTGQGVVAHLISIGSECPNTIVGLDFAFSMPSWYVRELGVKDSSAFWTAVANQSASWLSECPPPFYGFKGTTRPLDRELLRETEKLSPGAKSTFQINGPGAVGVGSIRGMPHLLKLRSAGWKIWPFDPPGFPLAVEIYPRILTGSVQKNAWRERIAYMARVFPNLAPRFQERAAGSEDAFDAAVSALILERHVEEFASLPDWSTIDPIFLEGWIWAPDVASPRIHR